MAASDTRRLDELIADFDTAMLVTRAPDGALRSRPMAIAGRHAGAVLYFATSIAAPKVGELEEEPDVNVVMQGDKKYLSLSGRARIVEDRNLIDELWSPAWQLWFPEGKDDPTLTLIEVEPETGEYWDRSGMKGARFLLGPARPSSRAKRRSTRIRARTAKSICEEKGSGFIFAPHMFEQSSENKSGTFSFPIDAVLEVVEDEGRGTLRSDANCSAKGHP